MIRMSAEDTTLYRGIFWIKDIDNVSGSGMYFRIPCDRNGIISPNFEIPQIMSSKNRDNYNHRNAWASLSRRETDGKPFDYYPRGRVEIRNGTAVVYVSPHIPLDELEKWLADTFNLTSSNGIKRIKFNQDYSEHYKCYMDND